jgi:excisionase family DNA binding protein
MSVRQMQPLNTKDGKIPEKPQRQNENRLLTVRQLARRLHVHRSTIHWLLRNKELPAFRVGRGWRFKLDAIEKWMRERETS